MFSSINNDANFLAYQDLVNDLTSEARRKAQQRINRHTNNAPLNDTPQYSAIAMPELDAPAYLQNQINFANQLSQAGSDRMIAGARELGKIAGQNYGLKVFLDNQARGVERDKAVAGIAQSIFSSPWAVGSSGRYWG
jgi:hypothetical protein